jgi:UDP-N-acetyl-D-glucosamine dehydrogenase
MIVIPAKADDNPQKSRYCIEMDISALTKKFETCAATIGIIGLGYVGLPLAKAAIAKGFKVIGCDVDADKVRQLTAGTSYIRHFSDDAVATMNKGGFRATTDFAALKDADAILICVPTPLTRTREPDLAYVVAATEAIVPHLRMGQLIALESTTYPGTTREVMQPILERNGLKSGRDFFLAYSPEREDPGNPDYNTANIPKIVGGDGPDALLLADTFYKALVPSTVPVSSLETAEAAKLTENIFRAVNIALVNELKIVFEAMGIDIWEVIEAAKTKPFGFMPFYPGPGLGGHCIPIDPFYLTWKARAHDISTKFVELAGEINTAMPRRVVDKLAEALSTHARKSLNGAKVLIVGVAYKKNVDDTRESPAFKIMEYLKQAGAEISYHDPFVREIPGGHDHGAFAGMKSVAVAAGYDAALIVTDHDDIDYAALAKTVPLIVDTRNACGKAGVTSGIVVKA